MPITEEGQKCIDALKFRHSIVTTFYEDFTGKLASVKFFFHQKSHTPKCKLKLQKKNVSESEKASKDDVQRKDAKAPHCLLVQSAMLDCTQSFESFHFKQGT